MGLAGLFVEHLLILVLFLATVYGLGRRVLSRLSFANVWEEVAISGGVGSGTLGTAVLVLGLARLWYPGFLLALVAACWVVAIPVWRDAAARGGAVWTRLRGLSRWSRWIAALAGLALLGLVTGLLVLALYPPSLWDGISYHLAAPKEYLEAHRLIVTDNLRFPVFPQLVEMLHLVMLGLLGDLPAQVAGVGLALLAAFSLIGWSRASSLPHGGVLAAAAWLGTPLVVVVASAGYIDAAQTVFLTLFLHAFAAFWQRDDPRWLGVAGLLGGFAAATKYTSVPFLAVPVLLLLLRSLRRRRLHLIGIFALAVAIPASPWYLRNLAVTGNPIFPFASRLFGLSFWDQEDLAHVSRDWTSHGSQRSLRAAVTLPYRLAFQQKNFRGEAPIPGYLFGLAALGLAVSWKRRDLALAGVILLPYLAMWFTTAQVLRYLVPVVPVLALLCGALAERTLALVPRSVAGRMVWPAIVAASLACLLPTATIVAQRLTLIGKPPVTAAQRRLFLQRFTTFECYRFLNAQWGQHARVFSFFDEYMTYWADGTRIGDAVGPYRYDKVNLSGGKELFRSLRAFDAGFVLVPHDAPFKLPSDRFFFTHFQPVFSCSGGCVYQLSPVALQQSEGPELIADRGFQETGSAAARRWRLAGGARMDASGERSHSGRVSALLVTPGSQVTREVRVAPGRVYLLRVWTRAEGVPGDLRLAVRFWGANDEYVGAFQVPGVAQQQWREYVIPVGVPLDVTRAALDLSLTMGGPAVIDDLSLRELRRESASAW